MTIFRWTTLVSWLWNTKSTDFYYWLLKMLLSFCCCFVMVDALWSIINDLSQVAPNQVFQKFKPWYCATDRSEVEEVGFDISVRDRTTYPLKLFENFGYVLYLPLRWKALGHVVLLLRGTIKRNYGDVIAAQKGRKLILTLQGFHVIQHKRSVNLYLTKKKAIACCMFFFPQKNTFKT